MVHMLSSGSNKSIPWAQIQRYRFIEWLFLWERRLNISTLMEVFTVSRPVASKDLNSYIKLHPKNVSAYHKSEKCYKPTSMFKPYYTSEDPDEYYSILAQVGKSYTGIKDTTLWSAPAIKRRIVPGVVSGILNAIQQQDAVEITYCSASSVAGQKRIIHPHRIVNASGRYHIRAYCEERKEYRDFNLSRILKDVRYVKKSIRQVIDDKQWIDKIDLIIGVNPQLTGEAAELISNEFGIEGELVIKTNAALINYLLIDNNIPSSITEEKNASPWQYPLVIANRHEVSEYLWS